jgi:hypothetical protein
MVKPHILLLLFCFNVAFSQVVINEIDADNPGSDNKEFIELKSTVPSFSLNGYSLVFFNGSTGSGTSSYLAIDLDGYTTDVNGIIVFGNSQVSPTPVSPYLALNSIQNGPDVVVLYQANATDFPIGTTAVNTNVVDVIAYSGDSSQPTSLMSILGVTTCSIDSQPTGSTSNSIQRTSSGAYSIGVPTPGMNNDGSGVVLNYITIASNLSTVSEGQQLQITATSSLAITSQSLSISFTLNNNSFTPADFSGNLSITLPVGSTSSTSVISILNDAVNDGDEEMIISVNALPSSYVLNTNNVVVRVVDINYSVSNFGKPTAPTFGLVSSTAPAGYYSSIEGLSGSSLKQAIQNIIANPSVVRAHNYGDIYDILKVADQNPENNNQVWLIYTESPRSKIDYQTGNSIVGKWNREHIYCQSRGGFTDGTSSTPDGISVWLPTGPNDIMAGHADAHHLRAVDGQENSSRNNSNYGVDYNGPTGSITNAWKGDVARALFYMAVRYNGLSVVNGNPTENILGQIGDLTTLLNWNQLDPSDDFEMNRNNYVYTWQVNRNPFIDHPNLADYIWGTHAGEPWFSNLTTNESVINSITVYPNPVKGNFNVSGISESTQLQVFNSLGINILDTRISMDTSFQCNWETGVYFIKITSDSVHAIKRILVQ